MQITKEIQSIDATKSCKRTIYVNSEHTPMKNQMLFFFKPEVFLTSSENWEQLTNNILSKIEDFGMRIHNLQVISGPFLAENDIMSNHYGVINKLSNSASKSVSDSSKIQFQNEYNIPFDKAQVFGGHEFLINFPQFTPLTLDYLWQNLTTTRLGSGCYCAELNLDGSKCFLLNAFHPRQLSHFIEPGRIILTAILSTDRDWKECRLDLLGSTDPYKAKIGSIRNYLLQNKESFSLNYFSKGNNGVHLSAGPIEALVEIERFYSSGAIEGLNKSSKNFIANILGAILNETQINFCKVNSDINLNSKRISIYDLTEEANVSELNPILSQIYW